MKVRKIFTISLISVISLPFVVIGISILLITMNFLGEMPTFEQLENPSSNVATEIYSDDNVLLGSIFMENRTFVSYEDLSPKLVEALISTEDKRFFSHSGIDIFGLMRVGFKTILLGDRRQGGGSTITQQLAKLLFPRDTAVYSNSFSKYSAIYVTKLKEWVTAVKLERNYTKKEIIAMYLSMAAYGSNAFGIKTAAATFFDKDPANLTTEEAALLVGVINAPTRYSPIINPEKSIERRNYVLQQMYRADYITEKELAVATQLPIKLKYSIQDHNVGLATYFRERLRKIMHAKKPQRQFYVNPQDYYSDSIEWINNPVFGWCNKNLKPDGTPYNLHSDGLKIYTTINSEMQKYAEEAVIYQLKNVLQPALNQEIKGRRGRFYGTETTPEQEEMLTWRNIRQTDRYREMKRAGASDEKILAAFKKKTKMKIFTWKGERDTVLTPIDSMHYINSILMAGLMAVEPSTGYVKAYVGGPNFRYFKYDHVTQSRRQVGSVIKPFLYTLAMQEGYSPCTEVLHIPQTFDVGDSIWVPRNSNPPKYDGKVVTLKWGLTMSSNYVSGWLMKQFNPSMMVDVCKKMGITAKIPAVYSAFLGSAEISLFEMVSAYTGFANKGVTVYPQMVTHIEDMNGNELARFSSTKKSEAISANTAHLMTLLMKNVVNSGTGGSLRYNYKLKSEIAGKTGTTQNHSDGWFMGYVPKLVCGVWVGCSDRNIHFQDMNGQGSRTALPIWGRFMQMIEGNDKLNVKSSDKFEVPATLSKIDMNCPGVSDADMADDAEM